METHNSSLHQFFIKNSLVYLDQIKLSYQAVDSSTPLPCPDQGKAQLDGTKIDMMCSTTVAVSQLTLSGSGVGFLCSIYINGGKPSVYLSPRFYAKPY